ncbi:MAG: putative bifunctional diguanylate cyclase/phosphodiesterase [Allosphingosinicella sp.]
MGRGSALFKRLVGAGEAETHAGRALLEQRFKVLQRQIPLLYTVALTNFLGLHLATGGTITNLYSVSTLLVILVVIRLVYWVTVRNRELPPERIIRELTRTWLYALVISVGFCAYALRLLATSEPEDHTYVILFGSLAAVGCAYGISSFASAARLPLLFLGLPLAVRLVLYGDPAHAGMGISIALVILLIHRLLSIHNRGFARLIESHTEIEEERERARRAERLAKAEKVRAKLIADTDPLTGLANRRAFLRALGRRCSGVAKSGGGFALAMVDLDGFKPINDTFGHAAGDCVLQEVGRRLQAAAGEAALIARTGGDEFALLLPGVRSEGAAKSVGAGVCAALQEPVGVEGREFRISGSCGITLLSRRECQVQEALIRADNALYRAKQNGRAGVAVFSPEMDAEHRRRKQVETALRIPALQDQIHLVYQPIRDLATGELRSFEALARWDHPELGRIPPDQFVPVAEQINVIEEISDKLLRRAAREARKWAESIRLSFNVSAVQLCTAGSSERILAVLAEAGMDPARLQVEVTETALLVDFEVARRNLQDLRTAGARIVLDDFGAGHASISYLREMQFDGIKLDGSLVSSIADSLRGRRLLKGVLDLCASIGLPCVAEHIETEEQLAVLRELGCRDGQGYVLSPPLHAAAAAALGAPRVRALGAQRAA